MTFDKEQLTIPKSWSDHLEPIYIQLVSKIKYHCSYGNVNSTLCLLPKPVGAYNWEPIPEVVSTYTLDAFEESQLNRRNLRILGISINLNLNTKTIVLG